MRREFRERSEAAGLPRQFLHATAAQELQGRILTKIFRDAFLHRLPREHASLLAAYRHSSEAIRDFLDYGHETGSFSSRESLIAAIPGFVDEIRRCKWNSRYEPGGIWAKDSSAPESVSAARPEERPEDRCPPRGYFEDFRLKTARKVGAIKRWNLLGAIPRIYWGKPHLQRLADYGIPAWMLDSLTSKLDGQQGKPEQGLRSAVTHEMLLQGCVLLAEICPSNLRAESVRNISGIADEALENMVRGAEAFSIGLRPPRTLTANVITRA
jgi:hypothetical protein